MDVFDLDRTLVDDYSSFARSFTQIRAQDIEDQVDEIYASRRFWPEPLITINPHYERGASVEALVADGSLHPDVARVFRVEGQSITLYRHQMQSVAKATARQSFAVTTGPVRESPSASSYRSSMRRSVHAPPAKGRARAPS